MNELHYRIVFNGITEFSSPDTLIRYLSDTHHLTHETIRNLMASPPRILCMARDTDHADIIRKDVERLGGRVTLEPMEIGKASPFPITRKHYKRIHKELLKSEKGNYRLTLFLIRIVLKSACIPLPLMSEGYEEKIESALNDSDMVMALDDSTFLILSLISGNSTVRTFKKKLNQTLTRLTGDDYTTAIGVARYPDDGNSVSDLLTVSEQALSRPQTGKSSPDGLPPSDRLSLNIIKDGTTALEMFQHCLISARGKKFKWLSGITIDDLWLGLGRLPRVRQNEFLYRLPVDAELVPELSMAIQEKRTPDDGPDALRRVDEIVIRMRGIDSHQQYTSVKKEIPDKLSDVKSFPTLPEIALKIFNIAKDPLATIDDITRVIQHDPALTLKLLKIVNSAFYGFPRTIETVKHAIIILGMEEIKNLAFGLAAAKAIDIAPVKGLYHPRQLWHHLMGTALICRHLYRRFEEHEEPGLFTAGLLHDFGKIFLIEHYPDLYGQLHLDAMDYAIPLYELEEECFGLNHALIGKHIASSWNLPESLIQAAAYHHQPFFAPEHSRLATIIGLADYLYHKAVDTDAHEFPNAGDSALLTYGHWSILNTIFPGITLDDLDIIAQEAARFMNENRRVFSILQ